MNFEVRTGRLSIFSTRLFVNLADGKVIKDQKKKTIMDKPVRYTCPKCGKRQCEVGEVRTASSFLTKIFNIQNRRFTSVTCTVCRYTELYNMPSKKIGDIIDFLAG
jgi:predicted nucleic-acid-binding Zn-ribbon protein